MGFEEWALKTMRTRLILRVNVYKAMWHRHTSEFTALLLSFDDDPHRPLFGGLWVQVYDPSIVDTDFWVTSNEAEWNKRLRHKLNTRFREDWIVKKEHVLGLTERLQAGESDSVLPLGSLVVLEKLTLLQGILTQVEKPSTRVDQNRLMTNMAHQLSAIRKLAFEQIYAGLD
jgi:hypothetical protein